MSARSAAHREKWRTRQLRKAGAIQMGVRCRAKVFQ